MSPQRPLTLQSTARLSSGYDIPLIGLGVYQNYSTKDCVTHALSAGYRHIDSAQAYKNEAHVGEAVWISSNSFQATKCISKTHGFERTLKGVDASLERFRTDYIDLFLIHDPLSGSTKRLETYRALLHARDNGKIRSVGVSNYNVHHLEELRDASLEHPAVNQIEFHPFCQNRPVVTYCGERGILIQAYSPLVRAERMDHPTLQSLAQKYRKTVAQILIRFALQHGFVVLPKSAQAARIEENADVFDFDLSEEDMQALRELDEGDEGSVGWGKVCMAAP